MDDTNIVPIPIPLPIPVPLPKDTYTNISQAYNMLHRSFDKMGLTLQQAENAQQRVAEIYAMVSGIPPLSTLVMIDMLYDIISKVIDISPSMKYIIEPEDVRRMNPNRRMHHSVICRFDIHPILMSKCYYNAPAIGLAPPEYISILMFACSKHGNRYKLHTLYYTDELECSPEPYVGCGRRDDFKINPVSINLQELEQYIYRRVCRFAAEKIIGGDRFYYFHKLRSELNTLSNELSEDSSMITLVRQKYGVQGTDGYIKHVLPWLQTLIEELIDEYD